MPSKPYYVDGQWNFTCDLCGRTEKSGQAEKTWDGHYVCKRHKERRNPLDFQRAVPAEKSPPWTRPEPPDIFVQYNFRLQLEDGSFLLQENLSYILRT